LDNVEGRNIQFEFRSAAGKSSELPSLAAELVALQVDIVVAFQTPAAAAAKQVTTEIPIVIEVADPVGTGLIASLARPGGNITGVTSATAELGAKNLELIAEVLPSARRVAVLANANDPFHKPFLGHIQAAANARKIEIKSVMVQASDQLDADFANVETWRADALLVQPSLPQKRVADLALKFRLPALSPSAMFCATGWHHTQPIWTRYIANARIRGQDLERQEAVRSAG
jgi:ABC-type uncharacterized transport system substrate-binding protein